MNENHQTIHFKAETQKLLDILIHSLYTDKEIFLRELISNAADAITKMNFIMLTEHDVLNPESELVIRIKTDPEKNQLMIEDTGIGMTSDEIIENLGTIAHSGIDAFIEASKEKDTKLSDLIGQFGVGFYSAFMVASSIQVESRSYRKDAAGILWSSNGVETYSIEPSTKDTRGTKITLNLAPESKEYTDLNRLRSIIHKHSDFIPHPIYLGDDTEPANQQNAIWRKNRNEITGEDYESFYRQYTLDIEKPLKHIHLSIDAPVQLYALLYIPASSEKPMFSLRKQDGLKLYARKILIQEYTTDLLPEYLRFIQGVVDSEDIPLNVSRESIQSNKIISQLKKIITGKVVDTLSEMAKDDNETYIKFWEKFGVFLKEGIAIDQEYHSALPSLLRFKTLNHSNTWSSMDDYISKKKESQDAIYYILGTDELSILQSPHLDYYRHHNFDVLLMTEPVDSFFLIRLEKYKDLKLVNVALQTPLIDKEDEKKEELPESEDTDKLCNQLKQVLGDRVSKVSISKRLYESPARLIDADTSITPELQRVYQLLKKDYPAPDKVLEINPNHPIIAKLSKMNTEDPLYTSIVFQIYENSLLVEGLHPNPASMITRIQTIIDAALGK